MGRNCGKHLVAVRLSEEVAKAGALCGRGKDTFDNNQMVRQKKRGGNFARRGRGDMGICDSVKVALMAIDLDSTHTRDVKFKN